MRAHPTSRKPVAVGATLLVAFFLMCFSMAPVRAGGPVIVGGGSTGGFGPDGQAFAWTASPIGYRTDGVTGLGVITNANADTRVAGMFQAWQDVTTSDITFSRLGAISATGAFADGDVSTVTEFNAVDAACNAGTQSPIVYDQTGSLFDSIVGPNSGVIGFAGACQLTSLGVINSAESALNGEFRDGVNNPPSNFELSDNEFDAVFIHEFGHFFGLDHSQINLNCLSPGCADFSDDSFGLPTLFPFLISGLEETAGVHPARTISMDDAAWVSELYPETVNNPPTQVPFASNRGTITGTVFYSDGMTQVQGGNVIARQVDDGGTPGINESRRNAVSVVSGFLFTEVPGNTSIPGASRSSFGSASVALRGTYRIPGLTAGNYQVETETINPAFTGGSGVGPLRISIIPLPGPAEFLSDPETNSDGSATPRNIFIAAGGTSSGQNIVLNNTPPRFDAFDAQALNNTVGTATPIGNGTHRFSTSPFTSIDEDFLSFSAAASVTMTFEVIGRRNVNFTSLADSMMEITNTSGVRQTRCRLLGSGGTFTSTCLNDDIDFFNGILDSGLEFQPLSAGTFVVHISEFRGDSRPDFQYDLIVTGTNINAADIFNNGTVNAASFAPAAAVSPGSIAATFGGNLANAGVAGAVPLPTTLGNATLRINGTLIPLFFTSTGQINLQIPWEMAGQAVGDIGDNFNGTNGGGEPVGLTPFAPGIFSTAQNGMGQGAILIANTSMLAAPMGMFPGSRPAVRGVDFLEIYWTGGGAVTNQPATGAAASASPLSATTTPPTITIGGVNAPVLFSGLAPGFVGLYVATCQVPAGSPTGNTINVVVTQGGVPSNTVTIAVSP